MSSVGDCFTLYAMGDKKASTRNDEGRRTIIKLHSPSSFVLRPSSFVLHPSSFIHTAELPGLDYDRRAIGKNLSNTICYFVRVVAHSQDCIRAHCIGVLHH